MKQFLHETWQLWFWALFRPSLLHERMVTWSSGSQEKGHNARSWNVLALKASPRFIAQYLCLLLLTSSPFLITIGLRDPGDWLLGIIGLVSAYGIGVLILPLGIHIPLLFGLLYVFQPEPFQIIHQRLIDRIDFFSITTQTVIMTMFAMIGMVLIFRVIQHLQKRMIRKIFRLVCGVLLLGWSNWFFGSLLRYLFTTSYIVILISIILLFLIANIFIESNDDFGESNDVFASTLGMITGLSSAINIWINSWILEGWWLPVLQIILIITIVLVMIVFGSFIGVILSVANNRQLAGIIFFIGITIVIIFMIRVIFPVNIMAIMDIITLPLPLALLIAWSIGFCVSPMRWNIPMSISILSIGAPASVLYMIFVSFEWMMILIPAVTLIGYYRLFPDYPVLGLQSFWYSQRLARGRSDDLTAYLRRLPPCNSELVWIPLPGHAQILKATWNVEPVAVGQILELMPIFRPGLSRTFKKGLTQAAFEELTTLVQAFSEGSTIDEIIADCVAIDSAAQSVTSATATSEVESSLQPVHQIMERSQRVNVAAFNYFYLESHLTPNAAESSTSIHSNVLGKLRAIASNIVKVPLYSDDITYERVLSQTLEELRNLTLPAQGVDSRLPWSTVIQRWQAIIEQECAIVHERIMFDRLAKVQTVYDLVKVVADPVIQTVLRSASPTGSILTILEETARDVQQAIEFSSAAQSEVRLEELLASLGNISRQINDDRWQAIMAQWRRVIQKAIPVVQARIVMEQLEDIETIEALIAIASDNHPVLKTLIPTLSQPNTFMDTDELSLTPNLLPLPDPTLEQLFPVFRSIAHDVGAALKSGTLPLRKRGLERCFLKLVTLQRRLPAYDLDGHDLDQWRTITECWTTIVQNELERQQPLSTDEIMNPFQAGNPLQSEQRYLFKGRKRFADDVVRQVLDRSRPTLVLHGPRRCGKSSFLLNLPNLLPSDMLPVYVDLQSAAVTRSESDFCYGLTQAIHRDLGGQGMTVPTVERTAFDPNPYLTLETWLDTAESRLGYQRMLICLDEFEKLGSLLREQRISYALLDELRHLIQHRQKIGFLFCGVQTLEELGPQWSSYFISVRPIEMVYLEPEEARELLTDPDPDFDIVYEDGIIEEILKITRSQPYLLQLVGEALVTQANEYQTKRITSPLLAEAIDVALERGEPYFENLWTEYTGTTPDEIRMGQDFLAALSEDQSLPLMEDDTARAVLRRLRRYHIIEQVQGEHYRFEVPLVKRWVQENRL